MQHVIAAIELAGGFDAYDVVRFFHDADYMMVAIGVAAELALLAIADVVTGGAESQLIFDVEDRLRETLRVVTSGTQDMEGKTLRGLLADAGEMLEFGDQAASGSAKSGIDPQP